MCDAILLADAIISLYTTNNWRISGWKTFLRFLETVSRFYNKPFHLLFVFHIFALFFFAFRMSVFCHDTVSRFVFILSRGQRSRPYILPEDLVGLVQDVVDTHPGLAFLKEAAEFHSRYVHTVIARIFYAVNRSWSGKITIPELRRSDLLQVLQLLEEEEDINQIMAYFSYEHFYVIYCKFWELDRDHDLFIDQNDLARHNDHGECLLNIHCFSQPTNIYFILFISQHFQHESLNEYFPDV